MFNFSNDKNNAKGHTIDIQLLLITVQEEAKKRKKKPLGLSKTATYIILIRDDLINRIIMV